MNRQLLFLSTCLLSAFFLQAKCPSVTRTISIGAAAPKSVLKITAQVTFSHLDSDIPTAWILQETWPAGCAIRSATWNGEDYPPIQRQADDCWIFGYPDTPWNVEDGTLAYELVLPSLQDDEEVRALQSFGKIYTCNDEDDVRGDTSLLVDINAPFYDILPLEIRISPGWNLISAPCRLSEETQAALLQGGAIYDIPGNATPGEMFFCQSPFPETPGTPFWYHEEGPHPRVVSLSACDPIADGLFPNGGQWHDGWNLVGVRGTMPQSVDSSQGLWLWQEGGYTRSPQNTLSPGQAGWIFR